ncbi:MAG TPA: hypothetical protein VFQ25_06930 [Ktedonobacterales bacterium]|nr:hypothetical protein [Ktedonobacterales bacterium]
MLTQASVPGRAIVAIVIRVLAVFDAAALLFAGIVHLVGVQIPLGAAVFEEPPIIPAGVVEGLAGVVFVVALYAMLTGKTWAWGITLAAHLFAIAGFLLGLYATRLGTTPFNYDYHRVMLAVFVVGLILLLLPAGRAALAYGGPRRRE